MIKKIGCALLVILLLLITAGIIGIRWFHNMWFKERPNHLTVTLDTTAIHFDWAEGRYGDYVEPHAAILIPVKMEDMPHNFCLQFDTGTPHTVIYKQALTSLKKNGLDIQEIMEEDQAFIEQLHFSLGGIPISMSKIKILADYGTPFGLDDTLSRIKLGTLGADFLDNRITLIDFKHQFIQIYAKRPDWMSTLTHFQSFDFTGRRFMLPARIDGKERTLFYDSGSSAFGLITSKKRYNRHTHPDSAEISYNSNRWGDPVYIHHKPTDKTLEIGGTQLPLTRISYVNMYANYQHFITPFTRIGGWLGNKPFTDSRLILDTQREEFWVD